ncbi:MAG: hypothetical protein ACI901_001991 [Octadecabacter sp.]|jgi:hypothetical protein
MSDQMVEFMKSEGLETSGITCVMDRLPGLYSISNDALGELSSQTGARTLPHIVFFKSLEFAILARLKIMISSICRKFLW